MKKNKKNANSNVEFGSEFGDLNNSKLYEISAAEKNKGQQTKKNEKNE